MKKVMLIAAVAMCMVACGNKNAKSCCAAEEAAATEEVVVAEEEALADTAEVMVEEVAEEMVVAE